MEQQNLFKIRDRRKRGWFFMDNEYLNGYAKCFGAVGTAIYVSLCRHANNETQKCFPSMDLISEELAISRPTIIKYLKLFEKYKIIAIYKEKDIKGRQRNNVYLLLDKDEWVPSKTILHGKAELNHLTYPSKTDSESRVKPVYHKETNSKETNIKEATTDVVADNHKDIERIIDLFKSVSLFTYKKWFGNTTERAAAAELATKLPEGKIEVLISKILPQINVLSYVPANCKAFKPTELLRNLDRVITKAKELKEKRSDIKKKIEIIK